MRGNTGPTCVRSTPRLWRGPNSKFMTERGISLLYKGIMDWPALLPSQLDYCLHLRGEEQIIFALAGHSDEHIVWFFQVASDDETWSIAHTDFMAQLLEWLTKEFSSKRFSLDHSQRVAAAIRRHHTILLPLLPRDLQFNLTEYYPGGNSLLWGTASEYFLALIEAQYVPEQIIEFEFPEIPIDIFKVVEEFVTTDAVQGIWRRPLDMLMHILMTAGQWRVKGLIELGSEVVGRYVNADTATNILNVAQTYVLPQLKEGLLYYS